RAGVVNGLYHVLGGHLSPIDGIGPDRLNIARLVDRAQPPVKEILLALNATVEGQSTAHYLTEQLHGRGVTVSRLAQGVPMG
ncbi:toprim domain-containing protein, partial [Acinetobacter baumannii]